jgi:glutathione synthase/RimK-type ligase-like ATP-grasp enzyme
MRIALLVSANLLPDSSDTRVDVFEFDEELATLTPAFAAEGMTLEARLWDDALTYAAEYDALLPLMVWDYFEGNEARFLATMTDAAKITPVFNAPNILRWNADKSYLAGLSERGAPVIPTRTVHGVSERDATAAFAAFGTDKIVIKPIVGGGAWRQVLHGQGDPWPAADQLPPEGALIQPFLPSVVEEGEFSLLYFDGQFSHALRKIAKDGDYRIQSSYGGREEPYQPSASDRATAEAVLASLDDTPLYARVDLLRGLDGQLALIELELIEPYLYLPLAEVRDDGLNAGAVRLAKALKARLLA